ncbi:MAG: VCBS repeat-containing protein, partial [Acidobacteria bacterium]
MTGRSCFVRGIVVFALATFAGDLTAAPPGAPASSSQPRDWRSGNPVMHAAGRGFPWLTLEDGRSLPLPAVRHSSVDATLRSASRPLSLAAGDIDGDGMPDLVAGYGTTAGGYVEVHSGNIDFLFPETAEAAERRGLGAFSSAPFLSHVTEIPVLSAPDFLACGDFDDDGRMDIVAGNRQQAALLWLRGRSDGNLSAASLDLPGAVTAMIAGDIATLDGVTDLAVAVDGPDGPSLLVFQSRRGAFLDIPAVLPLGSPATGLALGELDAETHLGLAAVAGSELVLVHGLPPAPARQNATERDIEQRTIPSENVTREQFLFRLDSVAIGDFIWDSRHRQEIAVLGDGLVHFLEANAPTSASGQSMTPHSVNPKTAAYSIRRQVAAPVSVAYGPGRPMGFLVSARVSSLPNDDLLVVDSAGQQVSVVLAESSGWKARRPEAQLPDFAVTQQAVHLPVEGSPLAVLPMRLNMDAMHDLVILRDSLDPISIAVTAASGTIVVNSAGSESDASFFDTECDVDTQTPGLQCTLTAALDVANQLAGAELIQFTVSRVSGLTLPNVTSPVTIDGGSSGAARVEIDSSNDGDGLLLFGGKSVVRRMVIHGALNPDGLSGNPAVSFEDNGGNFVEGSFLGTDVTGTQALPNFSGVDLEGPDNTAGGDVAAARNVISGNAFGGVTLAGSARTRVVGNYIGTDLTGLHALSNKVFGVAIGTIMPGGDPNQAIRSLDNALLNNVICATKKR